MSTYSAFCRVNGPDHLLNGRLRGYCQGHVPRVSRAADCGPTNLDNAQFPPVTKEWETKYPVPDMAPSLLAEEEGPPTVTLGFKAKSNAHSMCA
jgi:hypothetical protein